MARAVKRRSYDMANRARQARETRRRIIEAAAELFLREGYAATPVAAIAEKAGVALPTVYASVGGKAELLRAVTETTIRGDDDATPMADRGEWRDILDEPDPHRKLKAFVGFHRAICDREALVFAQIEAAAGADPAAGDLLAEHDHGRYEMQQALARSLPARRLRPGLNPGTAADVIWTLASERTYLALVRDRGWQPDAYEQWLFDQLVAALLP